jgi:uncharacterized protein involved in exopolysaccharide biosynthesis
MKKPVLIVLGSVFLVLSPLIFISGVAYTFTLPKVYSAKASLQITVPLDLNLSKDHPAFKELIRTEAYKITTPEVLNKVISALALSEKWGAERPLSLPITQELLLKHLIVDIPEKLLGVVEISGRSAYPQEAAQIANETLLAFRNALLDKELARIKRQLSAIEKTVEKATEKRNLLRTELDAPELSATEKDLKQKELQTAQAVLDEIKRQIKERVFEASKSPVEVISAAQIPLRPCSPNLMLNVLFSAALAGLFGIFGFGSLIVGLFRKKPTALKNDLSST